MIRDFIATASEIQLLRISAAEHTVLVIKEQYSFTDLSAVFAA
jgi:hypothetical protein